jgi:hypothetical protein
MKRMRAPMGRVNTPSTIEIAHCGPVSRTTENAWPPTKIMRICVPIIIVLTVMNSQLRRIPSNTLKVLSYCRLLQKISCDFSTPQRIPVLIHIENLHPHICIEHKRLQLLVLKIGLVRQDSASREIQYQGNGQLVN